MPDVTIVMPALGQTVSEGTVVKWLKRPGDAVAKDESLLVVQTDKAETEIPSPVSGRMGEVLVEEGQTVAVGTTLARLAGGAASPAPAGAPAAVTAPASRTPSPPAPAAVAAPARTTLQGRFLSPAVRKLAKESGVRSDALGAVAGTGRGGRLTREDLEKWLAREGPRATASGPDEEIIPLTGMRAKIAEHMLAAKRTAPHVNTVAEADMSAIVAARKLHGPAYKERHGHSLSYNAFLLKATAEALAEFPLVNAVLDERGIVTSRRVHLGMAVALEPSGLVVPVIRDADAKSVRHLALEAHSLSERARSRQLTADDMTGGTCTVTNPGVFGNLFGTPIIHLPQAAIVDFGAIKRRVVAVGEDSIGIRPMAYVVVAWDHRVMDGATAARFLQRLVRALESMPVDAID